MSPSTRFKPASVETNHKKHWFIGLYIYKKTSLDTFVYFPYFLHTFVDVKNVVIPSTIDIIVWVSGYDKQMWRHLNLKRQ